MLNEKYDYEIEGHKLEKISEEKDIGVIIHESLKPAKHVEAAAKKAISVLHQLFRAFHFRDKKSLLIFIKFMSDLI